MFTMSTPMPTHLTERARIRETITAELQQLTHASPLGATSTLADAYAVGYREALQKVLVIVGDND